jgi:hypothetical protein
MVKYIRGSEIFEGLWLEKKAGAPDRKSLRNPERHHTIKQWLQWQ